MRIKRLSIFYLLLMTLFSNCTKSNNGVVAEEKNPIVKKQKVDIAKESKEVKKDIVVNKNIQELKPTSEGFKYGEWKILNVINYYLPDDTDKVNAKILRRRIWILKEQKDFDLKYPDEISSYDDKGKLIGFLSYSDGMYMGDNYEYDENKRLISITPIMGDKIQDAKKVSLIYFKDEEGNIVRKSYQNNKLILEETEKKISNGWEYISKKEGYGDYFYKVHILLRDNKIIKFTNFSEIVGNTDYIFQYTNGRVVLIKELNNKTPLFTYNYIYGNTGLLAKASVIDHRKDKNRLLKEMVFSNYDEHGNWRKEEIHYSDGDPEIIIRGFQYLTQ